MLKQQKPIIIDDKTLKQSKKKNYLQKDKHYCACITSLGYFQAEIIIHTLFLNIYFNLVLA